MMFGRPWLKKKGPLWLFFGCFNYKATGCKFTRKIQEKVEKKRKTSRSCEVLFSIYVYK